MAGFTFWFIDPNSTTTLLNDQTNTFLRLDGMVGFGLLDMIPTAERLPNTDGLTPTVKAPWEPDRQIGIVLDIVDNTLADWVYRDSQLLAVLGMHQKQTDPQNPHLGILDILYPGGVTERYIDCWLIGYAQDSASQDGPFYGTRKLVFWAPDPHYYDPTLVTLNFSATIALMQGFLCPITFPWGGYNDRWYIEHLCTYGGTAPSFPTFTVIGPVVWPRFENITTGQWVEVPVWLQAGDTLVFDMATGTSTITRVAGGTETTNALMPGSELWPLLRPNQTVQICAGALGAGAHKMTYYLRYKGL